MILSTDVKARTTWQTPSSTLAVKGLLGFAFPINRSDWNSFQKGFLKTGKQQRIVILLIQLLCSCVYLWKIYGVKVGMMSWNVTSLFGATMTRMKFDWHNAPYLVMSGEEKNLQYKLWHVLVFRYGFFSVHWVFLNTETASNRRLIGSCTRSFHTFENGWHYAAFVLIY